MSYAQSEEMWSCEGSKSKVQWGRTAYFDFWDNGWPVDYDPQNPCIENEEKWVRL